MKRIGLLLVGLGAAILTAGCAPGIVIQNNAPFTVRAILVVGGQSQVLSPSAGGSSYAEVGSGSYQATVIPDAEWIEFARGTRQYLNEQLANSGALTGEQLLDVIRRLSDIAIAMDRFERAARSSAVGAASCSGAVSTEADGSVVVTTTEDGRILIECK
jgi:hypothetical protein